jgi:small multidrug resistance pump
VRKAWLLLGGAIACEVIGSLSLKAALDRPAMYVVVVCGFVGAFVLLSAVLRRGMALGVAYGVWGATGVAATSTLSALLYDERLTGVMVAGLVLIVLGVLTIELGSRSHGRSGDRQDLTR